MSSAKNDLLFLAAGIDQLKDFLLVDELFWPIGANSPIGGPPFPRLSAGSLLLSRERLRARRLPLDLDAQFVKLSSKMHSTINEWQIAWKNKVAKEFLMRLNMWRDFIEEYRRDPESNASRYSYEVRLRVMLHLLNLENEGTHPASLDLLAGLDKVLRSALVSGEFLWEPDLMDGFSRVVYWYLYGKLREEL